MQSDKETLFVNPNKSEVDFTVYTNLIALSCNVPSGGREAKENYILNCTLKQGSHPLTKKKVILKRLFFFRHSMLVQAVS